jgi:D-tyrosyl-tRNA(Tyr) deacylase
MRILIQRVTEASVQVDESVIGEIGPGLLLFVGIRDGDSAEEATMLAGKVANLRIFEDEAGKMNRSVLDCGYSALVVSQFTLYADLRRGRRPSFVEAARPEVAASLVEYFAGALRDLGLTVETGRFGADMDITLINDGPVTIWLDSADLRPAAND